MRVSDPHRHDDMMSHITQHNDMSGLGPFADFLQEEGAPGAIIAREAHKNFLEGNYHPLDGHNWFDRAEYNPPYYNHETAGWHDENGQNTTHSQLQEGSYEAVTNISRPYPGGNRIGYIAAYHAPQNRVRYYKNNPEAIALIYGVPVFSKQHLHRLTSDLPTPLRNYIHGQLEQHLPDIYPERMSRRRFAKKGNTGKSVTVPINGEPYSVTPNALGYGVVPTSNRIDRVSRSYQVYCDESGNPVSCSCPDHTYRHRACKHMQAIAGLNSGGEEEQDQEPVQMSAYRAPAGGAIVRGTQYKGGEMIPDIESSFVNPRRQMSRRVKRYSQNELTSFLNSIAQNEDDSISRKAFADWLEDNGHDVHPNVLKRLREYEGRMWVGLSPKGKVNAIPRLSKQVLEEMAARSPWGVPSGEFYHATATNNKGRAHRVRASGKMKTWKRDPDRFRVPWKYGLYDNGEFTQDNVHHWLTDDPTAEPG